jgi:hypothetical protein
MAKKSLYKVTFVNQGKVYEIYARHVGQGNLYGFVEVEGLVFGEKTTVVVDPTEERLKNEFEGVHISYIPIHAVIRIDEVEKRGAAKIIPISDKSGHFSAYPGAMAPAGESPNKGGHD